jgi:NTP pyrophosphatase (non-canonical NTP hydrolase)
MDKHDVPVGEYKTCLINDEQPEWGVLVYSRGASLTVLTEVAELVPDGRLLPGLGHPYDALFVVVGLEHIDSVTAHVEQEVAKLFPDDPRSQWAYGGNVGRSSLALFNCIMQLQHSTLGDDDAPNDAADFGRCLRMLEQTGLSIKDAKFVGFKWSVLLSMWPVLTQMYRREQFGQLGAVLREPDCVAKYRDNHFSFEFEFDSFAADHHELMVKQGFHSTEMPEDAYDKAISMCYIAHDQSVDLEIARGAKETECNWLNISELDDATVERRRAIGKFALIHSEVSEAFEAYVRSGESQELAEEMADIILRVMDLSSSMNLPLSKALTSKMEKNHNRPYKHGKEF